VEDFLRSWSYLGVFLGIVATGVGFPMPEELPVVIGGALAGGDKAYWWIMLPVCIAGVIVGDFFLYGIGRIWGPKMLKWAWVKRMLPPERLEKIEKNFRDYGVRILLFARLTPGVRAPIFFTAGLTKLSLARFVIADSIYAVPGVTILFFLGYWFSEAMVNLIKGELETVKHIIIVAIIAAIAVYILFKVFRKPVVTGSPRDMPKVVRRVEATIEKGIEGVRHSLEGLTTKIMNPHRAKGQEVNQSQQTHAAQPPPDGLQPPAEHPQHAPEAGSQPPPQ
jgi:membrane protein DedA with SNARE-associated domain